MAGKEKSCSLDVSLSVGRLRTTQLHNTATKPVLVNPSEQRGPLGLAGHPKASSL